MITDDQYARKSIEFLNELKTSITQEEKEHLKNKIDSPEFEDFFDNNFEEIIKFIEATPSKRLKLKKWEKEYSLFVLYAYIILLNTLNDNLIARRDFYSNMTYRADLAQLCRLSVLTKKVKFDFFSEELH